MIYNDLGVVHELKGEYEDSLKEKTKALEYFERGEDKYELARAYNNLGATCERMSDYKKAIEWYEKCIKTATEAGIKRPLGYGLRGTAHCYAKVGEDLEKAAGYTDKAVEIFEKLGEKRMISNCHDTYGLIYHKQRNWSKAREHFEKCIKLMRSVESLYGLSYIHRNYGKMLADKGEKEKAKKQLQKSIEIYEKLGNKKKVEEVKKELKKL